MQRRRQVAASPERTTSETAATISELIRDSLARSDQIALSDVDDALAKARPAFLALVAGGHLDVNPLVLVAGEPLHAKEIAGRVLESGRTRLGGKTPEQTITAMLAVGSKPGGPFTRVDKGTYTLADTDAQPQTPAPASKPKR